MTITVGALKRNARILSIAVDAESSVDVEYRPGAVTPALVEDVSKTDAEMPLVQFLSALLVKWDILGEDGQPLPVTPATLAELPLEFLRLVRDAILEDLRGPKATRAS